MTARAIDTLPSRARLWCFCADRALDPEEGAALLRRTREFVEGWTAHRRELSAAVEWREDRFLLVAVDESRTPASGCSVDALMRHVAGLEEALGISLLDTGPVWFRDSRDDGRVRCVEREEFRALAEEGIVGPATVVFDPTVETVGELRSGLLERPAAETWHARLLPRTDRPAGSGAT